MAEVCVVLEAFLISFFNQHAVVSPEYDTPLHPDMAAHESIHTCRVGAYTMLRSPPRWLVLHSMRNVLLPDLTLVLSAAGHWISATQAEKRKIVKRMMAVLMFEE